MEKAQVLLKTVLRIFKIALCLRNRHAFMWQSVEILKVFSILTSKQIFWKTKTFFKKLESCILVGNASFPYKTAISEVCLSLMTSYQARRNEKNSGSQQLWNIVSHGWPTKKTFNFKSSKRTRRTLMLARGG